MGDRCQFCEKKWKFYNNGKMEPLERFETIIEIEGIPVEITITYHKYCLVNSYEFNGNKILEFTS